MPHCLLYPNTHRSTYILLSGLTSHTEAEIKCWHNLLLGQISLCRVGMVKQGNDGLNINKVEKYSIPSNNTLDVTFQY